MFAISKCYEEQTLKKLKDKYNVSESLINQLHLTEKQAIDKYRHLLNRKNAIWEQKKERKQIDIYKKAIIELKRENKI